ncbi:MAG: hypothetical protein ACHQFZ_02185 [Acidimicrobiales bacterium]
MEQSVKKVQDSQTEPKLKETAPDALTVSSRAPIMNVTSPEAILSSGAPQAKPKRGVR